MSALWPRINVSLQSVAQILLVIGLGVWLTARRNLDRKALTAVSNVNWHALMPALMFSSVVGAVTPSGLLLLWPLLVLSVVHVVMGVVPALLLGWAARLPKDMCFFTVMAASLPNCGNLPWLFMPTIIRYFTPADQVTAQIQYSTGLTSVYTIMIVVITLVVPFLFKKAPETLMVPRNSSTVSLGAQEDQQEEQADLQHQQATADGPAVAHLQHQQHQQHQQPGKDTWQQQQQQHQHQQHLQPSHPAAAAAGATAWVLDMPSAVKRDSPTTLELGQMDSSGGSAAPPQVVAADVTAAQHSRDQHSAFQQSSSITRHQQQQQQQEHFHHHQPSVGVRDDSFSFSSHRSSSFLLQLSHSRQLFGSFSRSFSRGVNRSLRRSASLVQLVWSFPTGWQPAGAHGNRQQGRAAGCGGPPWLQRLSSAWSAFLAHPVVNLPLGVTLLGIACAAVGPVRGLLVNELAPLHWLWLALSWVGSAAAPLATMQIGAELMQTAPDGVSMHVSRRVQWTANAIAIVVKLVVVPLVNVGLLRTAGLSRLVPETDSVYQLLMLVEASVPAAVTLLVVCSRVYPDIRPLSSMLFWQYVASLFTLPVFLVWYLNMLEL